MQDLLADNISLHNQLKNFHGHIWPSTPAHLCPRLREGTTEGGPLPQFLGVMLLRIYCRSGPHPGIVGLLQADRLGGPAPQRNRLARV